MNRLSLHPSFSFVHICLVYHLLAQSYGRLCKVPSLPLKALPLFLQVLPLSSETLFLLGPVAVTQQGVTWGAELLLQIHR